MSRSQFAEGRQDKGKGCPVVCQAGTEGDRGLVLPTLEQSLKGMGGQHHAPARFTPKKETWYTLHK